jgi:membrane associated rhomboid family serine protease
MYALFLLGPGLEHYLGTRRFAIAYFTAAIGASVASYVFSDIGIVSVGASGAIFGLMTASMVIGKALRADTSQLAVLLLVNLLIGATVSGIDWRAHLGGAAVGALVAFVMVQAEAKRNKNLEYAGIFVIVIALIGLAVVRTNEIQQLILG